MRQFLKLAFVLTGISILFVQCQNTELDPSSTVVDFRQTESICVASWNIQMTNLGEAIGFGADLYNGLPILEDSAVPYDCDDNGCKRKAWSICEQIEALMEPLPDIFNFQEVFDEEATIELIACMENLGYTANTGFDESDQDNCIDELADNTGTVTSTIGGMIGTAGGGLLGGIIGHFAGRKVGEDVVNIASQESEGSGLITFSRLPMASPQTVVDFEDCNGCTGAANDCMADKGFSVTEYEIAPGCIYTNINTHLDAGEEPGDIQARLGQMQQIRDYIDNNIDPNSTFTISGDFNVQRDGTEYQTLLNILGLENTANIAGVPDLNTASGGQTLDYIFGENITTCTYTGWFMSENCWWEVYTEVIDDVLIDENSQDAPDLITLTQRYDTFEAIPFHNREGAVRICRTIENSETFDEEQCGWYASLVLIDALNSLDIVNIFDFYENETDIPDNIRQYFIEDCRGIRFMNPSDHKPIQSCIEFCCN